MRKNISLAFPRTPQPMEPKQSSRIGNLASWVVMIVATLAVVILANRFPVSAWY
jgi:hypothetical protein